MSEENGNILDLGSIDFTPDWAKKDAGVNVGKIRPEREDAGAGRPRPEGRNGGKPFGPKKPFVKKPFAGARRPRPQFDRPRPLEAEVKILPETKALGTIIRKLQADTHAYKLKDLAFHY